MSGVVVAVPGGSGGDGGCGFGDSGDDTGCGFDVSDDSYGSCGLGGGCGDGYDDGGWNGEDGGGFGFAVMVIM